MEGRGPGSITQNCSASVGGSVGGCLCVCARVCACVRARVRAGVQDEGARGGRNLARGRGRIDNIALTLYALALCIYVNASKAPLTDFAHLVPFAFSLFCSMAARSMYMSSDAGKVEKEMEEVATESVEEDEEVEGER
jgi:hypothetical protein